MTTTVESLEKWGKALADEDNPVGVALMNYAEQWRADLEALRPEAGPPKGHQTTRWEMDSNGCRVTLYFDGWENMEAYLASIKRREPQSEQGK